MKIAICSLSECKYSIIANSISETKYILIYDFIENKVIEKITNNFLNSPSSEIFCAQLLISKGISAVVCQNFEDNAKKLFDAANIQVIEDIQNMMV
ncbi:MAG: hypothetical protein CMF23_03545 [Ignavibacteriae bacterium]|nr:hypothetical protein [Ignavibacteriota bacterium]|tara:strand:- start:338 stop:625 length:288 start_codon:yes stop_codon:yes gene_type:complete